MQLLFILASLKPKSVVPEKICTHPMGNQEGGGGVLKAKFLEAMYENKQEFPEGRGAATQKTFCGGSMDIFWNCTITENGLPW